MNIPRPKELLKEELLDAITRSFENSNDIPPLRYNSIIDKISSLFKEIIESGDDYLSILNELCDHSDDRIAFEISKFLLNHNPEKALVLAMVLAMVFRPIQANMMIQSTRI
jgi:hypothetical protein